MKIHSRPLNYLSVPTAPAGPPGPSYYIPFWLGEGWGDVLKMTAGLLRRAQGKITEALLPSPVSDPSSEVCLLLVITGTEIDWTILHLILCQKLDKHITKLSVLKGLNIDQVMSLSTILFIMVKVKLSL